MWETLQGKLPEIRELLAEDVEAAFEGDPAAKSFGEIVVSYPSVYSLAIYRLAHVLYEAGVPQLPRIMAEHSHARTGIDIHPGAKIGRRFFIDHGTGVVIGETSEIGDRVRMYHGVTLGAFSPRRGQTIRGMKRHPTIRDDVTIYPGATILGGETEIGSGSVINGNAVRHGERSAGFPGRARGAPPGSAQGASQRERGAARLGYLVRSAPWLLCLLLVFSAGANADENPGWAYELADEIMSPYCPGRALSECPSGNADAMRRWIIEQEQAGVDRAEVEEALYARFGDQLLQAPKPEGVRPRRLRRARRRAASGRCRAGGFSVTAAGRQRRRLVP